MIEEKALIAFVAERCEHHVSLPGGVPRGMTQEDREAFAARFLRTGTRREGIVTMPTYAQPSTQDIERLNALWMEWRVSRYGSVALVPPPLRRMLSRGVIL